MSDEVEQIAAKLAKALEPFARYRGSDEYLKSADDDGYCQAVSYTAGAYRDAREALALYAASKEQSDG